MSEVKPRFEVHKLTGTGARKIASPTTQLDEKGKPVLDKDGLPKLLGGFTYADKEVDAGWMVYFPNGSSIHVWTKEEMERQGFLESPTLIDMESGEGVPTPDHQSLKDRAEQKERVTKNSKQSAATSLA
jgi:hypothetical protein